mmetsp:Transcript_27472/g.40405  ORF Transcript_27472/g.40405 Transcript_27472/m.40405 type:complete len:278 (+) Transcript_27472:3-836(+)
MKSSIKWECFRCFARNPLSLHRCRECQMGRLDVNKESNNEEIKTAKCSTQSKDSTLWECEECHFHNMESTKRCEVCNRWKPGSQSAKKHTPDSKSKELALPSDSKASANSKADDESNIGLWFDARRESYGLWECFRCLRKNPLSIDRCLDCLTLKGSPRKRKFPRDDSVDNVGPAKIVDTTEADGCRKPQKSLGAQNKQLKSIVEGGKLDKDEESSRIATSDGTQITSLPINGEKKITTGAAYWICQTCTYHNKFTAFNCEICFESRQRRIRKSKSL